MQATLLGLGNPDDRKRMGGRLRVMTVGEGPTNGDLHSSRTMTTLLDPRYRPFAGQTTPFNGFPFFGRLMNARVDA
jgi:hypothetical protein